MIRLKKTLAMLVAAAVAGAPSAPAFAGLNLVSNGSFESSTTGTNGSNYGEIYHSNNTGSAGPYTAGVGLNGWTSSGYNFLFNQANADTTTNGTTGGVVGQFNHIALWGNTNQSPGNGFTASPDGGNFVGLDAQTNYAGALSQTLTGLTVGQSYAVSFYWAAAQQYSFNGATGDSLKVSFGSSTDALGPLSIASHGFSGWQAVNLVFKADSTSDTLSFLAGSQNTPPPFVLLDGVSVGAVPEPSSLAMVGLGVLGLGLARVVRRKRLATA